MNKKVLFVLFIFLLNSILLAISNFDVINKGNPYNAMNIYCTNATIDGIKLKKNDEIGIFCENLCVGRYIVNGKEKQFFSMLATEDDPESSIIDGYIVDTELRFKIWSAKKDIVYNDIVLSIQSGDQLFTSTGTSVIAIAATSKGKNHPPKAVLPLSISVPAKSRVTIDGSQSSDKDGDEITFYWVSKDHKIKLDVNNSEKISFISPAKNGEYLITLQVSDGEFFSAPVAIKVIVMKNEE